MVQRLSLSPRRRAAEFQRLDQQHRSPAGRQGKNRASERRETAWYIDRKTISDYFYDLFESILNPFRIRHVDMRAFLGYNMAVIWIFAQCEID